MRRPLVLGITLAVAGAVVAGWLLLHGGSDAAVPPGVVRTSGPVPALTGATLDGPRWSLADHMGQVVVVNFWNPYCAPCRKEATILDVAMGRFLHDPVAVVGVLFSNANFPHDVPAARRFARELGEQFPTIDDPSGDIAARFGIRGIPTTVIADVRGRLRYAVLGALKPGQLERLVRRVLPR